MIRVVTTKIGRVSGKWRLYYLSMIILSLASCGLKDFDDFDILKIENPRPSVILPVAKGEIKLKELINLSEGGFLEITSEGLYQLVYHRTVESPEASVLMNVPNQMFRDGFNFPNLDNLPIDLIVPEGTVLEANYSDDISFDFEDEQKKITRIIFRSGNIRFRINSSIAHDVDVYVSLNEMRRNDQPFVQVFRTTHPNTKSIERSFDLAGYDVNLTTNSAGGVDINNVPIDIRLVLTGSGNPITSMDQIEIEVYLENLAFRYVEGDFGEINLPDFNGSLDIQVFDDLDFADFRLYPIVELEFKNSLGVPFSADISNVAVSFSDGRAQRLEGAFFDESFSLDYPRVAEVGKSISTFKLIDRNTSNIVETFFSGPNRLNYSVPMKLGDKVDELNFLLDTAKIILNGKVTIPFEGQIRRLELERIFRFEQNFESIDEVEKVELILELDNGFPVQLELQGYFLDDNGQVLDSVFSDNDRFLNPGIINSEGMVVQKNKSKKAIQLDKEKFERLKQSTNLKIVARLITSEGGTRDVKIFESYSLGLRATVSGTLTLDLNQ